MQNIRTQIYLPEDLRQQIDKDRSESGESLAQYLRKAAEQRLEKQRTEKADLKKLAEEVIGSSNRSDQEIQEWLDWIREERRLSDEVREKRLQKALQRR